MPNLDVSVNDLRTGDELAYFNGWVAISDAVQYPPSKDFPSGAWVVEVRYHDGGHGERIWDIRPDVPLPTLSINRNPKG